MSFNIRETLKSLVLGLLVSILAMPPQWAMADPLTETLEKIKTQVNDPENGIRAANDRLHKGNSTTYSSLLAADYVFGALFLAQFESILKSYRQETANEIERVQQEMASLSQSKAPAHEKVAMALNLAEQSSKLESDWNHFAFWDKQLRSDVAAILKIAEDPCSKERLQFISESIDASRYLQRQSFSVDNFAGQVQSIFDQITMTNDSNQEAMSVVRMLEDYSRQGKEVPPFYVAFSLGSDGSFRANNGSKTIGIISTVGVAASLQSSACASIAAQGGAAAAANAVTSTVLSGVATGCAVVAVAAVLYSLGKLFAACLEMVHEREKQLDLVNQINEIVKGAVPNREQSDAMLHEACVNVHKGASVGAVDTLPQLKKFMAEDVAIQPMAGWADSIWKEFDLILRAVEVPKAEDIRSAMKSALLTDRQNLGHERMILDRAMVVKTDFSSNDVAVDPLISAEAFLKRETNRIIVENTVSDSNPHKAIVIEELKK